MIKYERDFNKQYDEDIKKLLRGHNQQFCNIDDFSKKYVYVLEDENLIGALNVSCSWNWVSVGDVFYKDKEILKHLVLEAWDSYKEKAIGMKFFTTVQTRIEDFVSIGFTVNGKIKLSNTVLYYADLTSFNYPLVKGYKVLVINEPIKQYQEELDNHTNLFNIKHHIENAYEVFDVAALDGEQCIGGLQADVYNDMLYINRLVVDANYRKQSIGSTLTLCAIDYAKEKKLDFVMLGTCEFQAKDFYEKHGFKVVYVRKDNPKGYKTYTMLLQLRG